MDINQLPAFENAIARLFKKKDRTAVEDIIRKSFTKLPFAQGEIIQRNETEIICKRYLKDPTQNRSKKHGLRVWYAVYPDSILLMDVEKANESLKINRNTWQHLADLKVLLKKFTPSH